MRHSLGDGVSLGEDGKCFCSKGELVKYFDALKPFLFFVCIMSGSACFARTVVSGERLWNLQKLVTEASCDATVHQSDFAAGVMTISNAGVYFLAESVTGKIIISANNVVLDLNGKKISNTSDDAIVVNSVSDCTIMNGLLSSTSGCGIFVSSGSRVNIKDISANDCVEGIRLENTTDAIIKECDLVSSVTGLTIADSSSIFIKNTTASTNTYAGFSLLSSEANILLRCSAVNTGQELTSLEQNVYGFISENGTGNIFESCIAQSTLALTVTSESSKVVGFDLKGTETLSEIVNCTSDIVQTAPDGLAIPYGILLESNFSELVTVTGAGQGTVANTVDWSPDGAYLAAGGTTEVGGYEIQVFLFDRVAGTLTRTSTQNQGSECKGVSWSPDGTYLATSGEVEGSDSIQVFSFNSVTGKLTKTDGQSQGDPGQGISWSPDGTYLATSGDEEGGDEVQIFSFNSTTGTLTRTDGVSMGTLVAYDVAWTSDGAYLAAGGTAGAGDDIAIFLFDRNAETLSKKDGASQGSSCLTVSWSPDDAYLATGGVAEVADEIQVFSFNKTSETLSKVAGASQGAPFCQSVEWSPDGAYLATTGNTEGGYEIQIFSFNRATEQLTFVGGAAQGTAGADVAWSPDGAYLATGGDPEDLDDIQVFQALTFPSLNVIKDNVVHGASGGSPLGVGISGSSIENFIFGNSSYNNASFNYQFVTNIFDQRFDTTPSLLQNLSMNTQDPIFAP